MVGRQSILQQLKTLHSHSQCGELESGRYEGVPKDTKGARLWKGLIGKKQNLGQYGI